jgi:transposase
VLEADAPAPARPPDDAPHDGGEAGRSERRKPARRPLPDHLPRELVEHGADARACPACGGALRRLGEDATEVLD